MKDDVYMVDGIWKHSKILIMLPDIVSNALIMNIGIHVCVIAKQSLESLRSISQGKGMTMFL